MTGGCTGVRRCSAPQGSLAVLFLKQRDREGSGEALQQYLVVADPCFCGKVQPPEDKVMMNINTLRPIRFFLQREAHMENKCSHGWTLHRDSPQRLHSKFSARTRNGQACVGGHGEKIPAAPFSRAVVPMENVPLRAAERPPALPCLAGCSWRS